MPAELTERDLEVLPPHGEPTDDRRPRRRFRRMGEEQAHIHHELLPLDELESGADGVLARVAPYYQRAQTMTVARFLVTVTNPRRAAEKAVVRLVLPGAGSPCRMSRRSACRWAGRSRSR